MFNGLIYLVDPIAGCATAAFDTSPEGGMPQILQVTRNGSRLLTGLFQTGRILMLDTTNRFKLRQVAALDLGEGAGPHNIMLTDDDTRLIVTDYFLDEDNYPFANPGKVQLGGDCKVHVLKVTPHSLSATLGSTSTLAPRFRPVRHVPTGSRSGSQIKSRVGQMPHDEKLPTDRTLAEPPVTIQLMRRRRLGMILKFIELRLRFIVLMAGTGLVFASWDTLVNQVEKWGRPKGGRHPSSSSPAGDESFCPMHPSVVSEHRASARSAACRSRGAARRHREFCPPASCHRSGSHPGRLPRRASGPLP